MVKRTIWKLAAGGVAACAAAAAAGAAETVTYTHDALGGLVTVERKGDVTSNLTVERKHDKADSRTDVKVSGSPNPSPP